MMALRGVNRNAIISSYNGARLDIFATSLSIFSEVCEYKSGKCASLG